MGRFVNIREDGIVFLTSSAQMSDKDVAQWREEYLSIINSSPGKLKVLTYVGNLKVPFTSEQRTVIAETLKLARPKVFKSAIYGMSIFIRIVFQVVTAVAGRKDIRVFTSENDAVSWLNE